MWWESGLVLLKTSLLQALQSIMRSVLLHDSAPPPFLGGREGAPSSFFPFFILFFLLKIQKTSLRSGRLRWNTSALTFPSSWWAIRRTCGTMKTHGESWPRWSRYEADPAERHTNNRFSGSRCCRQSVLVNICFIWSPGWNPEFYLHRCAFKMCRKSNLLKFCGSYWNKNTFYWSLFFYAAQ